MVFCADVTLSSCQFFFFLRRKKVKTKEIELACCCDDLYHRPDFLGTLSEVSIHAAATKWWRHLSLPLNVPQWPSLCDMTVPIARTSNHYNVAYSIGLLLCPVHLSQQHGSFCDRTQTFRTVWVGFEVAVGPVRVSCIVGNIIDELSSEKENKTAFRFRCCVEHCERNNVHKKDEETWMSGLQRHTSGDLWPLKRRVENSSQMSLT